MNFKLTACLVAVATAVGLAFAVGHPAGADTSADLLSNGSFESATQATQAFPSTTVDRVSSVAHSGRWSEQITSDSTSKRAVSGFSYLPGMARQSAGTVITAHCWVTANIGGAYYAHLRITENPVSGPDIVNYSNTSAYVSSDDWQQVSMSYRVASSSSQLSLAVYSNSLTKQNAGTLWVDDCSVTAAAPAGSAPTPTPSRSPTPAPTPTPVPAAAGYRSLTPGTSWQWQIDGGTINETVLDGVDNPKKMYDVDMQNTDGATISRLKAKGIVVICYIETGSWESYRPDASAFPSSVLANTMGGYPNERYLDIRQISVLRPIMDARLSQAKAKGCEGIEPDIDDSWQEDTGLPLTEAIQIQYNRTLIADAHALGMSMGQKNGADAQFTKDELAAGADWALNEQCNQYSECSPYAAYIEAGKAVFQVEYQSEGMTTGAFCPADNAADFDGLLKGSSDTLSALPRTACRRG